MFELPQTMLVELTLDGSAWDERGVEVSSCTQKGSLAF